MASEKDSREVKVIKVDGVKIKLSRLDKKLYPNYLKKDITDYAQKIAPVMLSHIKNRPLTMHHFPDGVNKEGFYQKEVPEYFPKWIKTKSIKLHQGGSIKMVIVEKSADLVYLANQAVLANHIWLSRIDHLNFPDKIIFDLDPSKKNDLQDLRFAARQIKEIFEEKGFKVYIMTSGAKGFHIGIPIKPSKDFDAVRKFTQTIANELSQKYPDKFTTETSISKRKERIFLDYLRNSYGQTSICPYSLRALPDAPIATPVEWEELSSVKPQSYNLSNIFKRLSNKEDPWGDFYQNAKPI